MNKKPAKTSTADSGPEFYRLFWVIRKEQTKLKGKVSGTNPAYKSALAFADAQGWAWAQPLIEASRLDRVGEYGKAIQLLAETETDVPEQWQGLLQFIWGSALHAEGEYDNAIQAYRRALADPKFDTPGYAWNNLGLALFAKGEHDEAIQAYRKALADPKYDKPANAWNNLGVALSVKGEHDEAIQAYCKALDDPKYDTPGDAWNNLGGALSIKGEQDEAIKAFRKALADPNYDTPGYAWNNLGIALSAKGEHDEAIQAYHNALVDPKYDSPSKAWTNLAKTYADAGKKREAEESYEKALSSPDPLGGNHARSRVGLKILKSKILPGGLSPDDRAMVARLVTSTSTAEVESGIIAAINEAGDTQYEKYIGKSDSERVDTLSILRGWSSAVTLLEGSERRWRGGGYFLKWQGFGIVIDPGFDFLRNFHDAGYHGREIAAVVVSHNHPDHNSDLKAIDDLRYETTYATSYTSDWLRRKEQEANRTFCFGIRTPTALPNSDSRNRSISIRLS